ncbi:MAG TPA: hypothetical protein VEV19_00345 [Ktedonobacteraceae bacterium]|nr:hypothetical protein [Ktedonobacteraceae bacterium]
MRCPYCGSEGSRQVIHAHLTDQHGNKVVGRRDEQTGKLFYRLDCPLCDEYSEREVNPRGRDPAFLEAFEREIRLVAFDLLLYHIEAAHE